jgi:phosphate transport system permease protein
VGGEASPGSSAATTIKEPTITTDIPPSTGDANPDTMLSHHHPRWSDQIFGWMAKVSGAGILILLAAILTFLVAEAIPALHTDKANFLTTSAWDPDQTHAFGIAALAFGSLMTSLIALAIGAPIAVAVALYVSHYALGPVARPLAYAIDLLAAVPSVVYGLWGCCGWYPT